MWEVLISGFWSKEALYQQSTPAYFIGHVCSIVWFCEMFLFCLFNHLFFSLSDCEQLHWKYLRFPEFLHLARNFLNQSNCKTSNFHTQETSYIKYVPRHYRGTRHSRNQCFCLVMVNSGMPPTLSWPIKFQDPQNSNNSRKVLVAKLFFAYGYILIGITYKCIFY